MVTQSLDQNWVTPDRDVVLFGRALTWLVVSPVVVIFQGDKHFPPLQSKTDVGVVLPFLEKYKNLLCDVPHLYLMVRVNYSMFLIVRRVVSRFLFLLCHKISL